GPGMQPGRPGMPPGGPGMPPGGPGMPPGGPGMQPGRPGMPPGGPGIPGMPPDDRTAPVDALPYDPIKAMIQAQNKEKSSFIGKMLNTRGKKMIALVGGIVFVMFALLIVLKATKKKPEAPKVDPAVEARKQKEAEFKKLFDQAKELILNAQGRPDWNKIIKTLDSADKLIEGKVGPQKKVAESGKKLDDSIQFVLARVNRLGFATEELNKKLKGLPEIYKDIKDNISEKGSAWYKTNLDNVTKTISDRLKVSGVIRADIKKIKDYLDIAKTTAAKRKAVKLYDDIIDKYKDCKVAYNLRNELVREAFPAYVAKRKVQEFSGKPSLIDACRVTEDIIADQKAFQAAGGSVSVSNGGTAGDTKAVVNSGGGGGGGGGSIPASVRNKYNAKDFNGAKVEAEALAAKKTGAAADKFKALAGQLGIMASSWTAISVNSTNFAVVVSSIEKCLSVDAQFGGKHSGELKSKLAAAAKSLASVQIATGSYESAYISYKKAVSAGAQDVSNILSTLEAKAKNIYEDAYKMGSNSAGAKAKYRQVMNMVPASSEIYGKAKARLSGGPMPMKDPAIYIMSTATNNPRPMPAMRTIVKQMRPVMKTMKSMKSMKSMRVVVDDDDDDD
ncbi:MAG: hypothetical protein JXR95_03335, partial [Deltaproteobacteria bacterium]|nr:hypothetical protein [Deltaproteobacteria bacterium]